MENTTPRWEACKENTAPLRRGRRVTALESCFTTQLDDETRANNELQILEFERLVSSSEDISKCSKGDPEISSNDPLTHWIRYIQFVQESYPSDTQNQLKLVERCFRSMSKLHKYRSDERFIKICCSYADKSSRPHDIFKYCHELKIGVEIAIFWIAWAFVAEKEGNFPFAEKIYDKGIRKKAKPLQLLQKRYQHFLRRMSRHWINSTHIDETLDDEDGSISRSRGPLGSLTEDAMTRNDRTRVIGARRQNNPRQHLSAKTPFPIFVDENSAISTNLLDVSTGNLLDHSFQRDEDILKENTISTVRWNQLGALSTTSTYSQRFVAVPSHGQGRNPFSVHTDRECFIQHERDEQESISKEAFHRQTRDQRTFQVRSESSIAEKLSHDPLRYVRKPESRAIDESLDVTNAKKHCQEEVTASSLKPPLCISKLPPSQTSVEVSFEERRMLLGKYIVLPSSCNRNRLLSNKGKTYGLHNQFARYNATADVRIDHETKTMFDHKISIGLEDSGALLSSEKHKSEGIDRSLSYRDPNTPRNTSTASSKLDETFAAGVNTAKEEQTINTAWAQKEISMMFFGSPEAGIDHYSEATEKALRNKVISPEPDLSRPAAIGDSRSLLVALDELKIQETQSTKSRSTIAIYEDSIPLSEERESLLHRDLCSEVDRELKKVQKFCVYEEP